MAEIKWLGPSCFTEERGPPMMGAGQEPDGDNSRSNGARSNIRHNQIIYELKFSIISQLFKNIKSILVP